MEIFEEELTIPQLNRTRKVRTILPESFDNSKEHDLLIMQDGQNLCSPKTPEKNWGIDRYILIMELEGDISNLIVVTIDHGDVKRATEYNPFMIPSEGRGKGREYAEFIVNNLVPLMKSRYKIKDRVGIGGSSMGGLISLYMGLKYGDLFDKMMIFSPSLWISDRIFHQAIHYQPVKTPKIYLYGGGEESKLHLSNLNKLHDRLQNKNQSDVKIDVELSVSPEGKHDEFHWGREFPNALKWLYSK